MEVNMTRRKMMLMTAGATILGLVALVGFAGNNAFSANDEDESQEALIKVLDAAKINLQQGLAAGEQEGQPISAKFEVDEGKLQLSDAAAKYIPEMQTLKYPTKDSSPISIFNLLTMSAGFPEDNPWGDRQLSDTDQELIDLVKSGISFSSNPSSQFEYSNLGYALLGRIVSNVSGQHYQHYVIEKILRPLGMNDSEFEHEKIPAEKLALGYRWEDNQWPLQVRPLRQQTLLRWLPQES